VAIFHIAADYGSTDALVRRLGLLPHIWTAPAAARAGDLAALYSTTDHQWIAIGRIVHRARRSNRDHRWWTYIQWFPVRQPLAYDEALRTDELAGWKKLEQMAGRHALIKPADAGDVLLRTLTRRDPHAKARLAAWRSPRARFPHVNEQDLFDAWFDRSPPLQRLPDEHERFFARDIEEALVKRRKARRRAAADQLAIGSASTVCLRTATGNARYPDIVLVDRTREHTLLLIEVKLNARLSDLRLAGDVVDQVLEYRALMRAADPAWRVRPVIVVAQININVIERARDAAIDVWRFDRTTRRVKALAGHYG
jgi:hypothetical protein